MTLLPMWFAGAMAGLGAAVLVVALRSERRGGELPGSAFLFLAVGIYLGGVVARPFGPEMFYIPADLYGITGVSLALAGLYVAGFRPVPGLWALIALVAATFFFFGAAVGGQPITPDRAQRVLLTLHIGFILAASGFLFLLGVVAVLYILKERGLRLNPVGWIRRLPKLEHLDRLILRCLQLGFLLLTAGVSFGGVILVMVEQGPSVLAFSTLLIWAVLAALLYLRIWRGWRGHQLALVSASIVFLLLVSVTVTFGFNAFRHVGG